MANETCTGFLQGIPAQGFEWIEARVFETPTGVPRDHLTHDSRPRDKAEWVLTNGLTLGQWYDVRRYDPLIAYPALFRAFAEIPLADKEAIRRFANEHGALGIARPLDITAKDDPQRRLGVSGETWSELAAEIEAMQRALHLWGLVEKGDIAGLSRHLHWREAEIEKGTMKSAEGWRYDSHPELPRPKTPPPPASRMWQFIQPVSDWFKSNDVLTPAAFLVQRWINKHINDQVKPHLLFDVPSGKRVMRMVPSSLLGAMWLQFALAIDGHKEYRSCKECGSWFEVSSDTDGRTARRMFCSDPCKSREYRRTKDRARKLKDEGKSAKDIAQQLDRDVQTIKKWTAKKG